MQVEDRFLKYVVIDTQSQGGCENTPSTSKQFDLARLLVSELHELGVADASVDEHCYVMASIPSNLPEGTSAPALGFIAHLDTASEASGTDVHPRIVRGFDGSPIVLNANLGMVLDPAVFDELIAHKGEDLIVTDGTTLLGVDNKAGIAEIMTLVERLHDDPSIPHGKLCVAFTPDEEQGNGGTLLDIERFGADLAYTVDGGPVEELSYENFNAATAVVTVVGNVVHPGSAKNKMRNASSLAARFHVLLPAAETPEHTEGREGYFHLLKMEGGIATAKLTYLLRDFEEDGLARRKAVMEAAAVYLNEQVGADCVNVRITDSYRNMEQQILPHPELIDNAKAAMEEVDVTPLIIATRGGTDGAELSYRGLPCPNLGVGGGNYHGPYEYASIQSMRKVVDVLIALVQKFV